MANRAYLYSIDQNFTVLRDLSEWRSEIPLFYKIILGEQTKIVNSKIWDYEHPIAIQANFEAGFQKFFDFLNFLEGLKHVDVSFIQGVRNQTVEFFNEHDNRVLDMLFMEGGEIFDLISDIHPIEEQNQWLFEEIVAISSEIDKILHEKPEDIFENPTSVWLKDLKNDLKLLDVYWTYVTYYSFNNTGI